MSEKNLLLPCIVGAKPIYQSNDGFNVLNARIDWYSRAAEGLDKLGLPAGWMKRSFVVTANLDYDIELDGEKTYVFSGSVVEHPRFGIQFKADFCFPDEPVTVKMVTAYLDRLPHVGPKRSVQIVERFGAESVAGIIENEPMQLTAIPGITEKRVRLISKKWKEDAVLRRVYYWLSKHGIPMGRAAAIVKKFGLKSIEVLEENPYRLADIAGISFQTADVLAHKILETVPVEYRVEKCASFVLRQASCEGHLCLPFAELLQSVATELARFRAEPRIRDVLKQVVLNRFLLAKNDGVVYVYRPVVFEKERSVAAALAELNSYRSFYEISEDDIANAEKELLTSLGREIRLDVEQREAIRSAFENKITVITGGGGTGKSTICRCIQTVATYRNLETAFVAPTGAAAKVLEEKTGATASTIHRRLGLKPGDDGLVRINVDNYIGSSILVVDEFSMVGVDTLPYLLAAVESFEVTNIVVVGDPQQLPSVSAGSFLSDIMDSGVANVVELKQIHRQSERSHISKIANEIARGVVPEIPKESDDFFWIEAEDDEDAASIALMLCKDHFMASGSLRGFQVLSPMYRGSAGIDRLNSAIQAMSATAGEDPFVFKGRKFYKGDRVMQIVNNYDKDVFNGNMGYITEIDATPCENYKVMIGVEMLVAGGTFFVEYFDEQIEELKLCWCASVHKYQGSQIDNVLMVMASGQRCMMSRELVYTGMTRASKTLRVVGPSWILGTAARNQAIKKRHTHTEKLVRMAMGEDVDSLRVKNLELCREAVTHSA